jgi:tRNA_anti-like
MVSLLASMNCQPASLVLPKPISVRTLAEEYGRSSAAVRSKYDGKEIIVSGYTAEAAIMPQPDDDDQGLALLEEKDRKPAQQVACWFSKDQAEQFSTIKSGQFITVKGIFNGEAGVDLRFCKLVKIE